jgi:hypothetical protein
MTREEQLVRLLVRETIKEQIQLDEFPIGNFKMPKLNFGNQSQSQTQTRTPAEAKTQLDNHLSGNTSINNPKHIETLISQLSPQDQKNYKAKLAPKPAQKEPEHTTSTQPTNHLDNDPWSSDLGVRRATAATTRTGNFPIQRNESIQKKKNKRR